MTGWSHQGSSWECAVRTNMQVPALPWWLTQTVKVNPPAVWETWVRSLAREEPLEGGAWQPTPVFLSGEPPWTEEPGGLQAPASQGPRRLSTQRGRPRGEGTLQNFLRGKKVKGRKIHYSQESGTQWNRVSIKRVIDGPY